MYTVYVLKSLKDNNFYVGCTSNLEKRLINHCRGAVLSTKSRKPFELTFKEEYENKYTAFNKERYYKTAKGKKELKNRIDQCRVV